MKINGSSVLFEWRGSANSVLLGGDFNNYIFEKMKKVSPDYWVLEKELPLDGRFDYMFLVDRKAMLDPENPYTQAGGFGIRSELRMPNFSYPKEVFENPAVPRGEVVKKTIIDDLYKYEREVSFYFPKKSAKEKHLLIFQDGSDYIKFASVFNILDNLIYNGETVPFYAVFIPVKKEVRGREYLKYKKYAQFLKDFIVPLSKEFFEAEFDKISPLGASLGGFVSIGSVLEFPDIFSCAVSQSGAFITRLRSIENLRGKKIFLSTGNFETKVALSINILKQNREFKERLEKVNAIVNYSEHNDGHSYGNWKAHLGEALRFIGGES